MKKFRTRKIERLFSTLKLIVGVRNISICGRTGEYAKAEAEAGERASRDREDARAKTKQRLKEKKEARKRKAAEAQKAAEAELAAQ